MSEQDTGGGLVRLASPYKASPIDLCEHEHTRQVSEHDVECLDCGLVSA